MFKIYELKNKISNSVGLISHIALKKNRIIAKKELSR